MEHHSDAGHYRITVRPLRVRDTLAMHRARKAISEQGHDDETLLALYNYPLLVAATDRFEVAHDQDEPEAWQWQEQPIPEQDAYLDMPELVIIEWLTAVYEANPQHALGQLENLKNLISGLNANSTHSTD